MFESKTTDDLQDELDETPYLACTSRLQNWHKRGRDDSIQSQPVMDVVSQKLSLMRISLTKDQLYEARKITQCNACGRGRTD